MSIYASMSHAQGAERFLYIVYVIAMLALPAMHAGEEFRADRLPSDSVWLTVFVHGMINPGGFCLAKNTVRLLRDDVQNTQYAKSVHCIRANVFFYQAQAMGPLGLHYIDYKSGTIDFLPPRNGSYVMAYLFDQMHMHAGADQIDNRYYTFGWSGLFSPIARYQAAKELFEALDTEVQRLKERYLMVKVRLIGYSHGGNVVLNLGAVHQKEYPESSLIVDELVLLGTPIQSDTDYLINDSLFKYVYNIYSLADCVQKIDCFSLRRFFSGRIFTARKGFKLPHKLMQICLKVTVPAPKKYKQEKHKYEIVDFENPDIISGKSRLLLDVSPGHGELWFFGWTVQDYRVKYPLYPLPTIAVLPFITRNISQHYGIACGHNHLVVDVRPQQSCMIVTKKCSRDVIEHWIPFVSCDTLNHIKKRLACFAPQDYTQKEYGKQREQSIKDSYILI